ncbi:MAG: acyl-CoA dehydrogenase family protein, partial [Chloroflexota bacterium]|nr:acyl-CoA dehydrogenase family protein [Chloroflexota bacterium]
TNGVALAEMLFTLESARALYYRAISEQRLDPSVECVQRARAAHVQIQRGAVQLTGEAIRICGGRSMLKKHPLERYYRDARSSAVMRPWTQDIATQEAWETALKA